GRNGGTLQSARSLLYVDGLLLSNLMSNSWDGAPRWGMVAPGQIGAVDVLYGPYSALYPGNSMGTTVLIHTRLPDRLVASADAQYFSQDYGDRYGAGGHYDGHRLAAQLGDRQGRWRWLLALNQLDNHGSRCSTPPPKPAATRPPPCRWAAPRWTATPTARRAWSTAPTASSTPGRPRRRCRSEG